MLNKIVSLVSGLCVGVLEQLDRLQRGVWRGPPVPQQEEASGEVWRTCMRRPSLAEHDMQHAPLSK